MGNLDAFCWNMRGDNVMQNDRNDLISRQMAIEAIKEDKIDLTNPNVVAVFKATGDFEKVETQVMTCDRHIEILKDLPSAQPERIKGHWIEITLSNHTYKCSVCGRLLVNITDGKNNVAKNYPYCHCGADMRGEQDE